MEFRWNSYGIPTETPGNSIWKFPAPMSRRTHSILRRNQVSHIDGDLVEKMIWSDVLLGYQSKVYYR